MDDAPLRALDLLLETTVLLGTDMRTHLEAQGLTETKAHVLHLLHTEGPATQRALAAALAVAPRTVTSLVDDLTTAGLLTREPHPTDRRAHLVTLTDAGDELAGGLAGGRVQLAEALFVDWRLEEVDGFAERLDEVVAALHGLIEEDRR